MTQIKGFTITWKVNRSFYLLPTVVISNWENECYKKKSFSVKFIWLFAHITFLNLKERENYEHNITKTD